MLGYCSLSWNDVKFDQISISVDAVVVCVEDVQELQLRDVTQEISRKFQNLIVLQQPVGWS